MSGIDPEIKYKLFKITDRLYCIEMPNTYDLAMLFVRYQEYYESPSDNVRNSIFNLDHYMRWYSINNKSHKHNPKSHMSFSYPIDYVGYNIPSSVITDILIRNKYDGNLNMYDTLMREIYNSILDDIGRTTNNSFYLIGTPKMQSNTMKHEIAHGLYYLNGNYYAGVNKLIEDNITEGEINNFKSVLKNYHYSDDVMLDEIQAYLSTGDMMSELPKLSDTCLKAFKANFKSYYKGIKPKLIYKSVGNLKIMS